MRALAGRRTASAAAEPKPSGGELAPRLMDAQPYEVDPAERRAPDANAARHPGGRAVTRRCPGGVPLDVDAPRRSDGSTRST